MKIQITLSVDSEEEGRQLRQGLKDPTLRTLVRCVGILKTLPTDNARRRVIKYVGAYYDVETFIDVQRS